MASGRGSLAEDPTLRRKIEPLEFVNFFDPRQLRKEACLLYEVQWGSKSKWTHTARNTTQHVEINFLERLTTERHFHPSVRCSITWFLSWSPCWQCSKAIREFVTQHPSVTLVIYVARLYWHRDEQNRQGLRELINSGVTIQMMRIPEYDYCWRNFVNYPPGGEQCCPRYPPLFLELYTLELNFIILGLPPCIKISKLGWGPFANFSVIPQNHRSPMTPPLFGIYNIVKRFPMT
ncbi:C-_U-editing enzyme APOBEC-1-like [Sorex fumeus]|uniref:C->U-editing enzyme APOBEC-1-like n=1 Tax=Sorex fumeus TaxID=62283 RepID=UPI0024AD2009|nr:C->U-editing enzyme APOBEC-1-like [Sorex fumeus]XP_055990666.1 C->U-editing enzyme APOBEC-1-like [Sorex fumeus]XP_055990667.1 C->U-editing enzyme APOBEC-1-like [Sorex fumeus]